MKRYERPDAVVIDEISEGVYAASGTVEDGDCWTVTVKKDQKDAGGYSTFRVDAHHSNTVEHISLATTVTINFSDTVTAAEFEGFDVKVSGKKVVLTRESHANAYKSGDNFNTLLKIWSPDYQNIEPTDYTITCRKTVNVQGKGGDGN